MLWLGVGDDGGKSGKMVRVTSMTATTRSSLFESRETQGALLFGASGRWQTELAVMDGRWEGDEEKRREGDEEKRREESCGDG